MGKKREIPWIKFNFNHFFNDPDVAAMCDESIGVYMRMLKYLWNNDGFMPTDHKKLMNIFRLTKHKFKVLWIELEPCFTKEGEKFFQKRLLEELEEAANNFQKNSETGKENAIKGWQRRRDAMAADKAAGIQDSENSDKRVFKSSVDSVNPPPPKTEPIKRSQKDYSNKTCWEIREALVAYKAVFQDDVQTNCPLMKKLLVALLTIPQIDSEQQRVLAYVVQAKEAPKPKNADERMRLAISLVKCPKFPPADNAMEKAKHMIQGWRGETGAALQLAKLIPNKAV